jgi:hypothetical protein
MRMHATLPRSSAFGRSDVLSGAEPTALRSTAAVNEEPSALGSARTEEELLDLFLTTLRELYRGQHRCGVYRVQDGLGAERVAALGPEVLTWLRPRLLGASARGCTPMAHQLPARPQAGRGPLMAAPVYDSLALVSVVVVEAVPSAPDFTSFDLHLLGAVTALLSLALQGLRPARADPAPAFLDIDGPRAGRLQRRLLGGALPRESGVVADARYLPAFDVGGDFYDLAYLGNGRICATIGDVAGRGVSAALIMSRVSLEFRRVVRTGLSPSAVLAAVNDTLTDLEDELFVTAGCVQLDARRRRMSIANAGHFPALVRRASGETLAVGAPSGTPLGICPCVYSVDSVDLSPGDIVLLFTDGLVAAVDALGDGVNTDALVRLVVSAHHDLRAINDRVLAAATLCGHPVDDVTLVALQIAP